MFIVVVHTCGIDIISVTSDLSHLKIKSCVIPLPVRKLTSDVREEFPPEKSSNQSMSN